MRARHDDAIRRHDADAAVYAHATLAFAAPPLFRRRAVACR